MPGDIAKVVSKLRWAAHHVSLLDIAVADYVNLEPYEVRIKDEPEAQRHVATVHLRYPPPATLAHIVGDALNSLQGVVDYLASELVAREGETADSTTKFPIVGPDKDRAEPWVNIQRRGTERNAKGNLGSIDLIHDPAVLALLRDVQPYRAGDKWADHPLQVLRSLNGISKHRQPAVIVLTTGLGEMNFWNADGSLYSIGFDFGACHEDGDEIESFPYPDTMWPAKGPPHHGTVSACVALEGARRFDELRPLTVVDTLGEILTFIKEKVLVPLSWLF
jgi:hypothetical protein